MASGSDKPATASTSSGLTSESSGDDRNKEFRRQYRRSLGLTTPKTREEVTISLRARYRQSESRAQEEGKDVDIQRPPTDADGVLTLKVVLVGEAKVGKTTFAERVVLDSSKKFIPAPGYQVYPYEFTTSGGKSIRFNVWDRTTTQNYHTDKFDDQFKDANAVFLLFDVANRISAKNLMNWVKEVKDHCYNKHIPIMIIGNKIDGDPEAYKKIAPFYCKDYVSFCDISATANYKVDEPFRWLAGEVLNDRQLEFISKPEFKEPETKVVSGHTNKTTKQMEHLLGLDDEEDQ